MRITESRLRRVIRKIISEQMSDIGQSQTISGHINFNRPEEGDLFDKVNDFIEDDLRKVTEADVQWHDSVGISGMSQREILCDVCSTYQYAETALDYGNELLECKFSVSISSNASGVNEYRFTSLDGNCNNFTVEARLDDNMNYGSVILSIEEARSR